MTSHCSAATGSQQICGCLGRQTSPPTPTFLIEERCSLVSLQCSRILVLTYGDSHMAGAAPSYPNCPSAPKPSTNALYRLVSPNPTPSCFSRGPCVYIDWISMISGSSDILHTTCRIAYHGRRSGISSRQQHLAQALPQLPDPEHPSSETSEAILSAKI
jgi:hypothetical protein